LAKSAGLSLTRLLGGEEKPVPAYHSLGMAGPDGGSVTLGSGKIQDVGDHSFGLLADGRTGNDIGIFTISVIGIDSGGVEASKPCLVDINPTATITTSGIELLSGFSADGAAASDGTIALENSSITNTYVISAVDFVPDDYPHPISPASPRCGCESAFFNASKSLKTLDSGTTAGITCSFSRRSRWATETPTTSTRTPAAFSLVSASCSA
jgi:hypothetical protein